VKNIRNFEKQSPGFHQNSPKGRSLLGPHKEKEQLARGEFFRKRGRRRFQPKFSTKKKKGNKARGGKENPFPGEAMSIPRPPGGGGGPRTTNDRRSGFGAKGLPCFRVGGGGGEAPTPVRFESVPYLLGNLLSHVAPEGVEKKSFRDGSRGEPLSGSRFPGNERTLNPPNFLGGGGGVVIGG